MRVTLWKNGHYVCLDLRKNEEEEEEEEGWCFGRGVGEGLDEGGFGWLCEVASRGWDGVGWGIRHGWALAGREWCGEGRYGG